MGTRLEQLQAAAKAKTAAGQPIFTSTVNAPQVATPAVQTAAAPIPSIAPKSTVAQAPQRVENVKATAPVTSPKNALYTPAAAPKAAVSSLAVPQSNVVSSAPPQATPLTTPKTATPTTNYVAQGGKTLNDILYLKDNYRADNKDYIAKQASSLYSQLDPNTAAMVKGMSADQLRSYISGKGAGSSTTTATSSTEAPVEQAVPNDYLTEATKVYEQLLAKMTAEAKSMETDRKRRYDYANDVTQDNRTLQDASFYRNNAPTAWDGSTGYQAAMSDRNRSIEDHYTEESLLDGIASDYSQVNAFRNQAANYIDTKATELENADKQYNLQLAGLTGEINGQQTIQGKAAAAQLVSQNIANQIAQIDLSTYPETSKLQLQQLQQQVKAGSISNDTAAYQLSQLTDPNSTTNQAAALELQMKQIDASNYSEQQKLQLDQLRKTIAEIGKEPYQSAADARLDQLRVLTAEAELDKLQETAAKPTGKTYEDYQSNIEKIIQRDKKGVITNAPAVEEFILTSDLSDYEQYRAIKAAGLTWPEGVPVPSKGE